MPAVAVKLTVLVRMTPFCTSSLAATKERPPKPAPVETKMGIYGRLPCKAIVVASGSDA